MKRSELFTRLFIGILLLGTISAALIQWSHTPLIHARMAENGGWDPDVIQGVVGEPLLLRFTSDDVMHGFAVGQMDMKPLDIEPGKVSETWLNFDKPGTYTFYCTRWCGLNHWRMRGTIEVSGDNTTSPSNLSAADANEAIPLYVKLGLDLDAPHPAQTWPSRKPSSSNGQMLLSNLPFDSSTDYYLSHSPIEVFQELSDSGLNAEQRWDLVSAIWLSNTTAGGLAEGEFLYSQNCAACHGESGAGDGVFADQLAEKGVSTSSGMIGAQDMGIKKPVAFTGTDLLGASPAILHGKILRGGMGTGMPMWGNIFTDQQLWNLVAYLYAFQFK